MRPRLRSPFPSPAPLALSIFLLALAYVQTAPSLRAQPAVLSSEGQGARSVVYASPADADPAFEIGHYSGTVDFDPDPSATAYRTNTTSDGGPELYLASYTAAGALRFVHVFPATGATGRDDRGVHVSAAVEAGGGITFTGQSFGEVDFDPRPDATARIGGAGWTAFVVSFTADGALRFVRDVGGVPYRAGDRRGEGIPAGRQSYRVATYTSPPGADPAFEIGRYLGTVDFDPDPVGTEYRTSSSSEDNTELYLASYTAAGALRFVHVFPATGSYPWNIYGVYERAVVEDDKGISFTGYFWGEVDFDPDPDATVLMDITPDGSNAFVASFTENGDLRFARDIGGDPYGEGYDLAMDADNNIYTTGYIQSEEIDYLDGIFVEGYTLDGDLTFSHLLGSVWVDFPPYYVPSGGSGRAITTDAAGNVIVKGRFFGILDFDPDPAASAYLTSAQPQDPNYTDPFVASYTSAGAFRYAYVGTNVPPVAEAGADQVVVAGQAVTLDGSASYDPDGDPLLFDWTLATPAGNDAALSDGTGSTPSFCADVAGVFTATLTVFDGALYSEPVTVTVTAAAPEAVLDDLVEAVLALGPPPVGDGTLDQRFVRALTNKLDQAHRAIKWERPDLAGNHLAVFTSRVGMLRARGHLTEAQAAALAEPAGAVAEAVTAPCGEEAAAPQSTLSLPTPALALHTAQPNPFRTSTTLAFDVADEGTVRLALYDAVGPEVVRLVDGPVAAGRHEVRLDASSLPSGVYVARLTGERGLASTQRLTMQR